MITQQSFTQQLKKIAEVEQEINSKKLQVSESILGSNRMWDVDDNEIKGD